MDDVPYPIGICERMLVNEMNVCRAKGNPCCLSVQPALNHPSFENFVQTFLPYPKLPCGNSVRMSRGFG